MRLQAAHSPILSAAYMGPRVTSGGFFSERINSILLIPITSLGYYITIPAICLLVIDSQTVVAVGRMAEGGLQCNAGVEGETDGRAEAFYSGTLDSGCQPGAYTVGETVDSVG